MEQIIKQTGFKGSFAEFLHFMRTDKRFYVNTPEQLLKEASYIAKKPTPCCHAILASCHANPMA